MLERPEVMLPFPEPLDTVLVLPCYNEAARLEPERFQACPAGLLFVDDGSRDDTLSVIQEICRRNPERRAWLSLPRNCGKGEAVRRGVLAARPQARQAIGFWDADLATPLEALPLFEAVLHELPHVEIVLGSRVKLLGKHIRRKLHRHYFGRVFATLASMSLDLGVYDTQCGMKLFRASPWLEELFGPPFRTRWLFDVEILFRFLRAARGDASGLVELPVPQWEDLGGSKLTWDVVPGALWDLMRLTWQYRLQRS